MYAHLHNLPGITLILAATLRASPVGKRKVNLHLATARLGILAVIVGRKCDVPLKIASIIVNLYIAGLMLLSPNKKKRYCIALAGKHKRPFTVSAFYAPARQS